MSIADGTTDKKRMRNVCNRYDNVCHEKCKNESLLITLVKKCILFDIGSQCIASGIL